MVRELGVPTFDKSTSEISTEIHSVRDSINLGIYIYSYYYSLLTSSLPFPPPFCFAYTLEKLYV